MKVKKRINTDEDVELELIKSGKLKASTSKSTHYVNNKELYEEYKRYFDHKQDCLEKGLPIPALTDKIGRAIIQIATKRCNSRQFVGYSNSWKEEIISNAIMIAAIRGHNFNPEKSNNPFAYLTQICNNAIKEQLKKEKHQLYVKYKSMEEMNGFYGELDDNIDETDLNLYTDQDIINDRRRFIQDYEDRNFNKSKKCDEADEELGLMEFIEDD